MKYLILTTLLASSVFAQCFNFNEKDVTVKWVAFKTPSKVGVAGFFTKLGLNASYSGKSSDEVLTGLKFSIDPKSTETNNEGRNEKIVKYFFGKMVSEKITGSLKKANDSEIILDLKMNGIQREVPLSVTKTDTKIVASGVMDVFDFNLQESLSGINKACEQLHLGKTWNDVQLELTIKYSKSCK